MNSTINPANLWRSSETGLDAFRLVLPTSQLDPLLGAVRRSMDVGTPTEDLTAEDLPLGPLAEFVDALGEELRVGSGLRVVGGFPTEELSLDEIERMFWGIGLRIGNPVSQSVMGERLGHVVDVTKTDPHARAYRNSKELTPHTDPADVLSFLCINPAARGGTSRFVSSMTIHEEMRRHRPDLLERLYRGYRYHRFGEQQPGFPAITNHRIPVFSEHEGFVSCRFVRIYLEVAAEEDPSIQLDDLDIEALDMLENLAADPDLHHQFRLEAGEAVFANNFTVMHARAAFEDDPARPPRHLLRLWLSTDPMRPLTPAIEHYEGEPGIPPIEGRTPSYETNRDVE